MKHNLPTSMKYINFTYDFYYKDRLDKQTRIFIEPIVNGQINIRLSHKSWFGFHHRGMSRSLTLADNENHADSIIQVSKNENHFIGMYRSSEPLNITAIDDKLRPLQVIHIDQPINSITTYSSVQVYEFIYYIVDVPSYFNITMKNKNGDNIHNLTYRYSSN